MDVDRDRAAYRRQWATAAAGLLNAVLAAWMIFGLRPLGPLHVCAVVLAVVTAVPLLLRSRPAFGAAALISAAVLIVPTVAYFFFGGAYYLPSVVLLLLARCAGDLRPPRGVWPALVAVVVAGILVAWSPAIWDSQYRPTHAFAAEFPPGAEPASRDILNGDGSGIGRGATGVTAGTSDTGGRRVYVTFRADLTAAEQAVLERRLHELMPGATIRRCRRAGDC
ncbi:hypothetical protein Dvina_15510 [Dactylosporangium vinaceum]|uniref:Uncharacterized protein n=1 Tax=Dactylosporangium vinaceum TaxID=53362 RepID=A0ABV5M223_9ACTN|nr:hypothetical protein [Dactylosporangium vinaceum]UAB99357.1 hypothetical protein Dvina_15510 [Dactylosporangium vinaceum]